MADLEPNVAPTQLSYRDRLVQHVRVPLHFNTYALLISGGGNALLGFLFWSVAARIFSPAVIGINSGTVSSVLFLGGVSQFGLSVATMRFLPSAGRHSTRLVWAVYATCAVGALLAATVFLVGLPVWAGRLGIYVSNPVQTVVFFFCVISWTFFSIQDNVLIGLRQAKWVPLENLSANTLKLLLLIPAKIFLPIDGAALAWFISGALAVPPVSALVFGRLLREQESADSGNGSLPSRGRFVAFASTNYAGSLLTLASQTLMPLVVLGIAGPRVSGFFYVPWIVYFGLTTVANTASSSLLAEASLFPDRAEELAVRFLRQTFRLIIPVSILIAIGAPLFLRAFGEAYVSHDQTALRLFAIACIPATVVPAYLNVLRVRHQNAVMLCCMALTTGCSLTLSAALLPNHGVTGVAAAVAAVQAGAALLVVAVVKIARPPSSAHLTAEESSLVRLG